MESIFRICQNFHFCCGSEYPVPCWLSESDGTNWGSSRSETTPGASLRSPASIPGVSGSRHFPSGALYVRLKTNRFLFLSPNESFLLIRAQTCSRHIFFIINSPNSYSIGSTYLSNPHFYSHEYFLVRRTLVYNCSFAQIVLSPHHVSEF